MNLLTIGIIAFVLALLVLVFVLVLIQSSSPKTYHYDFWAEPEEDTHRGDE